MAVFSQRGAALEWGDGQQAGHAGRWEGSSLRVPGAQWRRSGGGPPGALRPAAPAPAAPEISADTARVTSGTLTAGISRRAAAHPARQRRTAAGARSPKVPQASWTAIQAAITGTASPAARAQATISRSRR